MNKLKIAVIFLTSFFIKNAVCGDVIFLNLTNETVKTRLIYSLQDKDATEDRVVGSFDALAIPIDTVARDLEVSFCEKFIFDAQKVAKGKQYEYFGGIFNKIDLKDIISKNKDILVVINHVDGVFSPSKMIVFNDANSFDQYIFSSKGVFRGLMTITADDNDISKIINDIKKIIDIKSSFEKIEEFIRERSVEMSKIIERKEKEKIDEENAEERKLRDEEDSKWNSIGFLERTKILTRRGFKELTDRTSKVKSSFERTGDLDKFLYYVENYEKKSRKYLVDLKIKLERLISELGKSIVNISDLHDKEILIKEGKEFTVKTIVTPESQKSQKIVSQSSVKKTEPFKLAFGVKKEDLNVKLFASFSKRMRSYYDRINGLVRKMGLGREEKVVFEVPKEVKPEEVEGEEFKKKESKKNVITMDDSSEEEEGEVIKDEEDLDAPGIEELDQYTKTKESGKKLKEVSTIVKDKSLKVKPKFEVSFTDELKKKFEEYQKRTKEKGTDETVKNIAENKKSQQKKNPSPIGIEKEKVKVIDKDEDSKLNTSNLWDFTEEDVLVLSHNRARSEIGVKKFGVTEQIKRLKSTVEKLKEKETLSDVEKSELKRAEDGLKIAEDGLKKLEEELKKLEASEFERLKKK